MSQMTSSNQKLKNERNQYTIIDVADTLEIVNFLHCNIRFAFFRDRPK